MPSLGDLPAEVILLICEQLFPDTRSYDDRKGLFNIHAVNRHFRDSMRKRLFRNITLTFSLQDDLPSTFQEWESRAWEAPHMVSLLQDNADIRSSVRSLRMRFQLFPLQEWTDTSFDSIKRRLEVNISDLANKHTRMFTGDGRDFTKIRTRNVKERQEYVVLAYTALFVIRCGLSPTKNWTQNLAPMLRQLLHQLPNLQEVESIGADDAKFRISLTMRKLCLGYADTLVLRTTPPQTSGICFRSWPPWLRSLSPLYESDLTSRHSDTQRTQDFIRVGSQFTALTIDSGDNSLAVTDWPDDPALNVWREGLQQLRYLTTLTLSAKLERYYGDSLTAQARTGRLDHRLEDLFDTALVLDHVKELRLRHWTVPAMILHRKLTRSFPALRKLELHNFAILCSSRRQGEEMWREWIDAIAEDGEVRVVLSMPKVCVDLRDPTYPADREFEIVDLGREARLALEERIE